MTWSRLTEDTNARLDLLGRPVAEPGEGYTSRYGAPAEGVNTDHKAYAVTMIQAHELLQSIAGMLEKASDAYVGSTYVTRNGEEYEVGHYRQAAGYVERAIADANELAANVAPHLRSLLVTIADNVPPGRKHGHGL